MTFYHLSYLVCFVAAYKGPNAGVLGNVGNSYWHYQVLTTPLSYFQQFRYCQAVDDIMSAVQNILEFIVVDLIGIVFSAGLCYKMTGFNIFKTLGYLQKEYGLMLTVSQVSTFKRSWPVHL